ncbi:3-dehydroquinate synthase [Roseimicrobium gellanilyticum]|uniref:3-dehydroquinate synthase n=1 Tax=Roseimicrobium gellanilyticum TaxID=748857 RepID=A0A366HF62_9BACT|nr:3-dehydroquinate synthase [Roseimicrobium gellanilyticum]RBP41212.1 3-dehydroquinate synthase [Roseimicrobium gellanilyticum]
MLERTFKVEYAQRVLFTRDMFGLENHVLRDLLASAREGDRVTKALVFVDSHVAEARPDLLPALEAYAAAHSTVFSLAAPAVIVPGGETCKNDFAIVQQCWEAISEACLDRHSLVFVIGGGAVLDLVCFAASTAHRGIRHVRFPTTTLSQGDGGVGVKNGVNYFGKKNWVGSFSVPYAIVNDFALLETLPIREKRCGLIEAIKVSLIRDAEFYHWLEQNADALAELEPDAVERAVRRSAELHVEHITTNGDPFELGSARPLDFGHWVAHKLEQVSHFEIKHGEAVAIGMAVDLRYSVKAGILDDATAQRIISLIRRVGFATYAPQLLESTKDGELVILAGLEEFREHLGGELTITLVPEIGRKLEVHEMNTSYIVDTLKELVEARV